MDISLSSGELVFRPAALAFGMTDKQLKKAAGAARQLSKVAPGVYLPEHRVLVFAEDWHRSVALAIASREAYATTRSPHSERPVISCESAAAVHHLPMLSADFARVHFTRRTSRSGSIRYLRHTHPGPLDDAYITEVDGVAVTTIERTAVDVACRGGFAAALAILDSALRAGADRAAMEQLVSATRCPGIAVARKALRWADGLSASVGESWSRAQMIQAGLPIPELQAEFFLDGQHFFVDFLLPGGVIGEFDGIKKYTKLLREGEESSDVVIREKHREDLLRAAGYDVVRWIWADLSAHLMVPRVQRRLDVA